MCTISPSLKNLYLNEHQNRQEFNHEMTFFPRAREAGFLVSDTNSALRNSASLVKSLTTLPAFASAFINSSAVLGGFLGVPLALSGLRHGLKKGAAAFSCGDPEGGAQSALWSAFSAGHTGVSGVLAAEGIMGLQGVAIPTAMTPAFGSLGLLMYAGLLGHSGYGLMAVRRFKNDLNSVLEKKGPEGVKEWLRSQICLSSDEISEIQKTAKEPDKAKKNRLQRKWNALELRTSPECAALIREKLLNRDADLDPKDVAELVDHVRKVNFKTMIKHIFIIFISCISILAFIATFLALGPTSPFLFALAATTWIAVDSSKLHNFIGEKCWIWHSKDKESILKESSCQTLPSIALG